MKSFAVAKDEIRSVHRPRSGSHRAAISSRAAGFHPSAGTDLTEKSTCFRKCFFLVGEDGFEPSKRNAADLQSVPFGHSGTPPYLVVSERLGYYSTDFGFVKGENEEKVKFGFSK